MKQLIAILFLGISSLVTAQDNPAYQSKVSTLNSTLETLYSVISGEKGEQRNWELFRYLFHEDANLIPTRRNVDSPMSARFLSPEDYINSSGDYLIKNGFYEIELSRDVQQYGNIAQVFSTYESYHSKDDTVPFMRGINSIQLLYDGSRWWIINIYWMQESEEHPIPQKYLPN